MPPSRCYPAQGPAAGRQPAAAATLVATPLPALPDLHPRDRARDHELLDLRGALEDVVDLRVAVPALDRELPRIAVAAEDLDRPLCHPHGDLARLELAHRALGVLEAVLVAAHPGGAPDEQAGRVDLHLHARERERDRLVFDDLAAELLALLGVVERILVRRTRYPERLGADRRARRPEALHRSLRLALLALPHAGDALVELLLAAEHVAGGHATVIQEHVGRVGRPQSVLRDLRALGDPLDLTHRDDECRVAARSQLRVDGRDHHVDVGDAPVGRPCLLAVDNPLARRLVELRARAHTRDI